MTAGVFDYGAVYALKGFDKFPRNAADKSFAVLEEAADRYDETAACGSSEEAVSVDNCGFGARACGGGSGCPACGTCAADDDVIVAYIICGFCYGDGIMSSVFFRRFVGFHGVPFFVLCF